MSSFSKTIVLALKINNIFPKFIKQILLLGYFSSFPNTFVSACDLRYIQNEMENLFYFQRLLSWCLI